MEAVRGWVWIFSGIAHYRAHGRLRFSLSFHWLPRDPRVSKNAYHLAKKIQKFRLKVKWNHSNFQRWSGTAEISLTFAEPLSSFQSLEVSHQP